MTTESVSQILAQTKTQTRRVIVPQPTITDDGGYLWKKHAGNLLAPYCPYGKVGAELLVREAYKGWEDPKTGLDYIEYKDGTRVAIPNEQAAGDFIAGRFDKWQNPRFMPAWASRIVLEITDVTVEQLQRIDAQGARLEGCDDQDPLSSFKTRWDHLNLYRGYGWGTNPLVWTITFKLKGGLQCTPDLPRF